MNTITVGRKQTARGQAQLHIIRAVARAVLEDRRHVESRPYGPAPQFVPAGLGSLTPARQRGDTSGSELVARLDAAVLAAELTGSRRDLERVRGWERALKAMDAPAPITARDLNAAEDAKRVAELLWKRARGDAKAAMAETERYLTWLDRHLAATPGELERLDRATRGARRVQWMCRSRAGNQPLPGYELAKALVKIRKGKLQARRALEVQHAQRDRILASARARLAASKPRKAQHTPIRRLPDPVYVVTIPALTVTCPGLKIIVPFQRLQLDLRAASRTEAQTEALRTVLSQESSPVRANKGRLERADGLVPTIWEAWLTLADMLYVAQIEENEQQHCAVA